MRTIACRLLGIFLFAVAAPTTLLADESDSAIAVELFNAGKALADAGDYARACPKFADSARRDARVGTLARLAECEEQLGHMVGARLHWGEAKALAQRLNDSRLDHAIREYERIDGLVPKVQLSLVGALPPGLVITIDDATVDQVALGVAIPIEVGTHSIHATASGKKALVATVVSKGDGAVTPISLEFEDGPLLSPQTAPSPPPAAAPGGLAQQEQTKASTWNTQKTLALVAGGAGIAAVGVGSYFGARAFSKWSDAQSQCSAGCGPGDAALATKSDARTAATVSTVTFAVGGAALIGAVVLWLTAPKGAGRAVQVTAMLGPSVVGFALSGTLHP